jgi:sulfate adenylyltransferase
VDFPLNTAGELFYVGGKVRGLQLPAHHDFLGLRHTPEQLRAHFCRKGWRDVIVFQTRNPMHQAHFQMTLHAARERGANLLIHPVTGMTQSGDVDHYCRVRCYRALLPRYPRGPGRTLFAGFGDAHGRAARGRLARDHSA